MLPFSKSLKALPSKAFQLLSEKCYQCYRFPEEDFNLASAGNSCGKVAIRYKYNEQLSYLVGEPKMIDPEIGLMRM